jgi:UDP-N-acetylglucosamine acyltransferase
MAEIHPTAIIEKGAELGKDVTVGPYSIIGPHAILQDRVTVKAHVVVDGFTTLQEGVTIWPGAVLGSKPQDLKYRGEKTYVIIGKNTEIREFVTVNSSCGEETVVSIGEGCLLMAYCHVAHNCEVGNHVIMSNGATLAGHVTVEDHAIIGGLSAVHQFCRIGTYAMVGGMSGVAQDIAPYTIGAGRPYRIAGLNLVGLKRHGFSLEKRKALTGAFRLLFRNDLLLQEALQKIEKEVEPTPEVLHLLEFCRASKRGVTGAGGQELQDNEMEKEQKTVACPS